MALTPSTMLPIGTKAPDFSLSDAISGETVSLSNYADAKALMVMFICNHCPYVVNIRESFLHFENEYESKGLGVVAISSNDIEACPDDRPEKMSEDARNYS